MGGLNLNGLGRRYEASKGAKTESKSEVKLAAQTKPESGAALADKDIPRVQKAHAQKYWFENSLFKTARAESGQIPAWYMNWVIWPIVGLLLLCVFLFILFFIWLKSRFEFIWLRAVQSNEIEIQKDFRRFEQAGDSLMSFYLIFSLFNILYFSLLIIPAAIKIYSITRFNFSGHDFSYLWPALLPWFALIIFSGIVVCLFGMIVSDFVVPLMAWNEISFSEAFKKWLGLYKASRFRVWGYMGVKLLVAIGAAALSMALMIFIVLILVILGAIVIGGLYWLVAILMKAKVVFWVLAVIILVPALVLFFLMIMGTFLPPAVFFRVYSIGFLSRLTGFSGQSSQSL